MGDLCGGKSNKHLCIYQTDVKLISNAVIRNKELKRDPPGVNFVSNSVLVSPGTSELCFQQCDSE